MLSAAANGGEGTMPGDYRGWSGGPAGPLGPPPIPMAGNAFRTPIPPLPAARSMPPSFQPPLRGPPMVPPPGLPPAAYPGRPPRRHRRRRPLTPEIVVERRSRHHGSSGGRARVFTIPVDNRPTLGLRGPPKCVIEIERVRCRRRRRPRSYCYDDYDDDYDDYPPPPPLPLPVQLPPQSNVVVANPISVPCAPTAQTGALNPAEALLNNLTQEAIDNLPRQTVHLQPIHLPGSQADANTELQTVIFPAEIINPVDGSLSVIRANGSGTNLNTIPAVPPPLNIAAAPSNIVLPSIIQRPGLNVAPAAGLIPAPITPRPPAAVSPALTGNPIRQRFLDLFQRLRFPSSPEQPAAAPLPPQPAVGPIRPTLPSMSQFEPSPNPYPPANIQPYRSTLGAPNRPSTYTPTVTPSTPAYRPASLNPSTGGSDIGPYRPANITPYMNVGTRPTAYSGAGLEVAPNPYPPVVSGVNTAYTPPSGPAMPRSILRNPYPTVGTNTVYSRLNPSNVSSSSLANSSITPKST